MATRSSGRGSGRKRGGAGGCLLALLDRRLALTWVNESFARAAGRAPEDLVGREFFSIYPNPANEAIFRRVLQTGRPFAARSGEGRALRLSEGSSCRWDCELSPARDAAGAVAGLVLVLRDVTSRVNLEREPLVPAWRGEPSAGAWRAAARP